MSSELAVLRSPRTPLRTQLWTSSHAVLAPLTRSLHGCGMVLTCIGLDSDMASRARVRAPELVGAGGWLNTGGKDLSLADLRGKCVVLGPV